MKRPEDLKEANKMHVILQDFKKVLRYISGAPIFFFGLFYNRIIKVTLFSLLLSLRRTMIATCYSVDSL